MECDTFQDSESYNWTTNILLLNILSFVGRMMRVDLQTLCSTAKAPLAFDFLLSTSFFEFRSLVILLRRYTNSSTSSKAVLLMVTGSSFLVFIFMVFLLVMLKLRSICFPSESVMSILARMSWWRETKELCRRRNLDHLRILWMSTVFPYWCTLHISSSASEQL